MASEIVQFFEGFVFRGRPPGAAEPPAWHVEVGRYVEVEGTGRTMLPALVLTPEQAEAAGFPLSSVIGEINAAALAERDAAVAALAALRQEHNELKARHAEMQTESA